VADGTGRHAPFQLGENKWQTKLKTIR